VRAGDGERGVVGNLFDLGFIDERYHVGQLDIEGVHEH
jgi:hypothetical protein